VEITAYITVNLLLFFSWHVLLFRNKNSLSFIDRILGAVVLGLAQIILTEMLLGIVLKKLYATPLFILNVSISLVILILAVVIRKPVFSVASGTNPGRKNSVISWHLTDVFKELNDKINQFFNILKNDWILLTIFILFFFCFGYLLFIGYLFPPYAWDALLYHLPTVGFILQSGAIEQILYNQLIYTFINIFPKNIDLFFLWNVIFLKSSTIVDLSQLFFTVAGMLAVYSMAIKLKIKKTLAIYSAFLFFFAPVIILQSTANYVDLSVSVLFLIAINFIIHDTHEELSLTKNKSMVLRRRNIRVFLAGLTAGILLGSKGSGPLFVAALSILFLFVELKRRFSLNFQENTPPVKRHFALKKIVARYAVYFIVPVILLGSYWYIRNWVNYDNPIYPFRVTLFGKTLFKGILTEILHSDPIVKNLSPFVRPFYVWLENVEYYSYASELSGFGPLWFILFLPGIVFSTFLVIWKKKYDFLFIAVTVMFVFLFHPNNWNTRYVIFIFGLGSLAFGSMVDYFGKRGKILQFLALLLVIYTFFASNSPHVTPEKIKEFVHLSANKRTLAQMEEPYVLNKTQRGNYGLWAWISSNVSAGETLVYTFTPTLIGPLWNSNFSNKIVYIKEGEFEKWLEKLEVNNATHVLILLKPRSMEYVWLTKLRELRHIPEWEAVYKRFRLEYSDSNYAVLRFR
jgi:hypothetical protein